MFLVSCSLSISFSLCLLQVTVSAVLTSSPVQSGILATHAVYLYSMCVMGRKTALMRLMSCRTARIAPAIWMSLPVKMGVASSSTFSKESVCVCVCVCACVRKKEVFVCKSGIYFCFHSIESNKLLLLPSCDHVNDCGDASDELGCTYETCSSEQFTCGNGVCISASSICDGYSDCLDGSDEVESLCSTPQPTCSPLHFMCTSGECIDNHKVCDGKKDCSDESDEKGCGESCGNLTFCDNIDMNWCKLSERTTSVSHNQAGCLFFKVITNILLFCFYSVESNKRILLSNQSAFWEDYSDPLLNLN